MRKRKEKDQCDSLQESAGVWSDYRMQSRSRFFRVVVPKACEESEAGRISPFGRLCENTVHGSTRLTTNGVVSLEIEYLSVRPEHRRRAPREFSHSLSFEMTMLGLRAFVRNQNPKPQI